MAASFVCNLMPDSIVGTFGTRVDRDESGPYNVGRMRMWFLEMAASGTYTNSGNPVDTGDLGLGAAVRQLTGAKQIFQILSMGPIFVAALATAIQFLYDADKDKCAFYASSPGVPIWTELANGTSLAGFTRALRVMGD